MLIYLKNIDRFSYGQIVPQSTVGAEIKRPNPFLDQAMEQLTVLGGSKGGWWLLGGYIGR